MDGCRFRNKKITTMYDNNKVEESFKDATGITFIPDSSLGFAGIPVISLMFPHDHPKIIDGYIILKEYKLTERPYGHAVRNIRLFLFERNGKLDISIVFKDTRDAVNLNGLEFDKKELQLFKEKVDVNSCYCFTTGYYKNGQANISEIVKYYDKILFDGYTLFAKLHA